VDFPSLDISLIAMVLWVLLLFSSWFSCAFGCGFSYYFLEALDGQNGIPIIAWVELLVLESLVGQTL